MPDNFIYGIDVSHNNGNIDWSKVKNSTPVISFAYIKATQGVGYQDPKCVANAAAATKAALPFGFYHFASLNDPVNVAKDAAAEGAAFSTAMKALPAAALMPVLDIETNDKNLTTQQVQLWITTFLDTMRSLGHPDVMLYSYKPFFDTNLPANHPFGELPLWLAQYRNVAAPSLPRGWAQYTVWQYSSQGKVNGISSDCDLNKTDASFLAPRVTSHIAATVPAPGLAVPLQSRSDIIAGPGKDIDTTV